MLEVTCREKTVHDHAIMRNQQNTLSAGTEAAATWPFEDSVRSRRTLSVPSNSVGPVELCRSRRTLCSVRAEKSSGEFDRTSYKLNVAAGLINI